MLGGDGLRISVVRYDKPLPAMPDESEPTPVEGGSWVGNEWKAGSSGSGGRGVSWVGMEEEANGECQ